MPERGRTGITVVVPTRNEPHLGSWLEELLAVITPSFGEVVIVDDSDDAGRAAMMASIAPAGDRVRVVVGEGRGKGDAVRKGILEARGDVVAYVDADTDRDRLPLLMEFAALIESEGFDGVIAERRSKWQYRNVPRFLLSLVLFVAQRYFIFHSNLFYDTQCGLKAFRHDAAMKLASLQTVDGGMFDIEYLSIALHNGMRIAQIPIAPMRELRPSRLHLLRAMWNDPLDLLHVKWNSILGRYKP
jgi:dolichyl-phosphate beta-glucosyltransferase